LQDKVRIKVKFLKVHKSDIDLVNQNTSKKEAMKDRNSNHNQEEVVDMKVEKRVSKI
jgi:hypothetical protein